MHLRVNVITGADNIDEGVAYIRENVIPELRQQRGFRGLIASTTRADRVVAVLTLWDTEQDMRASESTASKVRQEALGIVRGDVTVETFEQVSEATGAEAPRRRLLQSDH